MRECQKLWEKLWGGLCILYPTYTGGEAPPIRTIQNAQAPPEFFSKFLTLPQIISTSLAKQKGNILYKNCTVGAVLVLRYRLYLVMWKSLIVGKRLLTEKIQSAWVIFVENLTVTSKNASVHKKLRFSSFPEAQRNGKSVPFNVSK